MTLLYTSYYGRLREMEEKFKDRGVLKVAISRKIPNGVNVFLRLEDFVPSSELVHLAKDNIITNKEFHKMYYEQNLRNCDKDKFKKVIADLSDAFSVIVFLSVMKNLMRAYAIGMTLPNGLRKNAELELQNLQEKGVFSYG